MGNRTLKSVLTHFVILEIGWAVATIVCLLLLVNLSITSNLTYPANYPETEIANIKEQLANDSLNFAELPTFYNAQLEDNAGKVITSTIPKKEQPYIKKAKKDGSTQSTTFLGSKNFIYLTGKSQNLIISYQLMSDFVSPTLRNYLPKAELLFYGLSLLLWFIGFILIIGYFAKKVNKELIKISQTNDQIRQMTLSFDVPKSNILEVNQVLDSLNVMKNELSHALQEQWSLQKTQKNTLQALTHDIRTPITLISGNLELLEETTMTDEQIELMTHLDKGVGRLNQYVDELKNLSGLETAETTREVISNELLAEWISLAKGLAAKKNIHVVIQKQDTSSLLISAKDITTAFQNVIQNAVDYSAQHTTITLAFEDHPSNYQLVITDSGKGFSPEALKNGTERFYTSSFDRGSGHFGLGLAIVAEIMANTNGRIELSNDFTDTACTGGKVRLCLNKQ